MHEASLMRDFMAKIQAIAEEQSAERIVGVHVLLGALSHMSPEHFREHFADSAADTLAEGATLYIETSDDTAAPGADSILLRAVDIE